MRRLTFEQGVETLQGLIEREQSLPVLIAVHGKKDSGKTTLINQLVSYFRSYGSLVANTEGVTIPKNLKDLQYPESTAEIIFFHFGSEKPFSNRVPHLSVGIYNSSRCSKPNYDYNLLIDNLSSEKKVQ